MSHRLVRLQLTCLLLACLLAGCAADSDATRENSMNSTTDAPPRKIVIGSLMYAMWGEYPGVQQRLDALSGWIDRMAAEAERKYPGAGLDLVVLPEIAVTGGRKGSAAERAVPLEGAVLETLGAAARKHKTYVVVPLDLLSDPRAKTVHNACVLLDRSGRPAGTYRKVYAVGSRESDLLEGGVTPGDDFPVFRCDFGVLGIQICYDMAFDAGWEMLARKGAEIVAWPTQSPGIVKMQARALAGGHYIVSSTWRNNASLFDPTGHVIGQITGKDGVLVEQVDLTWRLIGWQAKLRNGKILTDKYGDRVGYRYSEAEDEGIFWSNDPDTPIDRMIRELDLELPDEARERNRKLQDALRGGPPKAD